jgi:hypothetical protein
LSIIQLHDFQLFLVFDGFHHNRMIIGLVLLPPQGMDGITLAGVQHPHLDAGFIGRETHLASQGVNFANKLTFGGTADRRIAGHQRDIVQRKRC